VTKVARAEALAQVVVTPVAATVAAPVEAEATVAQAVVAEATPAEAVVPVADLVAVAARAAVVQPQRLPSPPPR